MKKANSTQQMKLVESLSLVEMTHLYFSWLPTLFGGLVRVSKDEELKNVSINFVGLPLLKLERNFNDKRLGVFFWIVGGLLARRGGSFSFTVNEAQLITSLNDFSPRLPWPIYMITQYPIHNRVMFLFSQHLLTIR